MNPRQELLRQLPAVGILVDEARSRLESLAEADGRLLGFLARRMLDEHRRRLIAGEASQPPSLGECVDGLGDALEAWRGSSTCRVVNASGVVLHSGLGRAVLPQAAVDALKGGGRYALLEVDKEEGKRRKRDAFCEELLCELTGAEAALVVNNNAAATLLILRAMAKDREVIVSRSQMIEIGGSYRLPDVFETSGARLREVGTTNRSRVSDYEEAMCEETGALMLVHTSNYRIVGFTKHVDIEEMVALGKRKELPVIHDLGSGCIIDLVPHGVDDEPPVQHSVATGADVVCFSGDKLIGGPQSGIIVGKKESIERIRRDAMARAMRIDKLTCMALETTLKLYFEPESLMENVPALRMLSEGLEAVEERANKLMHRVGRAVEGQGIELEIVAEESQMGAGSLPARGIPTLCLAMTTDGRSAESFARALRVRAIPIFSRVKDVRVLFDARTLFDDDLDLVADAVREVIVTRDSK